MDIARGGKFIKHELWICRYYPSFDHKMNLGDKIPYHFEKIKRGFKQEKYKERKRV